MTGREASFTHSDALPDQGVQGLVAESSNPARLEAVIALAVDYRGDVTIVRKSDGATIEGYVFDSGRRDGHVFLRVVPRASNERIRIAADDIARLELTGRDTAAGKSFDTWVKKYIQKKLAGEEASIHSEPLAEE
jgi:hypothetical protein